MMLLDLQIANTQMSHSLAYFTADPMTGKIGPLRFVWEDTSPTTLTPQIGLPIQVGQLIGFALLCDGARLNDFDQFDRGEFTLSFSQTGDLAIVHDDGDGRLSELAGELRLSIDAKAASGYLTGSSNTVEIVFAALSNSTMARFGELIFRMDVGANTAAALVAAQVDNADGFDMMLRPQIKFENGAWNDLIDFDETIEKDTDSAVMVAEASPQNPRLKMDLSHYPLNYQDLQTRFIDLGWATEIDLSGLPQHDGIDRILMPSVSIQDLGQENFILAPT